MVSGNCNVLLYILNGKCENLLSNNEEYEFNKCVKS